MSGRIRAKWIALAIALLAAGPAIANQAQAPYSVTKTFDVNRGGMLEVSLGVGDIIVSSWEKNQVFVRAEGIDPEEESRLKISQVGSTVRVSYRPEWDSFGRARFTVQVPAEFNTDLRTAGGDIQLQGTFKGMLEGHTSGGDIRLANVDGTVTMHTSGGDVTAGKVNGTVQLHTSGGDIRVDNSGGQVELTTSGGDIRVGNVGKSLNARTSGGDVIIGDVGGQADVSTAGGDIHVGKVSGNATLRTAGGDVELKGATGVVKAKTAGGDVILNNISGSIDAMTAGGDVRAELRPAANTRSRLQSSGGDLYLSLPENARTRIEAIIDVRGRWRDNQDSYEIASDFKSQSYVKDPDTKEIRGTYILNGGGSEISLETVNGMIEIRRLPQ